MKVEVRYGGKVHILQLYVVEGEGPNLLGTDWLLEVKLDWESLKVASVAAGGEVEALLTKYQEVFEEGLHRTKEHLQGYCTPQVKCHPQIPQRQVCWWGGGSLINKIPGGV